jgi:hypothetical protein
MRASLMILISLHSNYLIGVKIKEAWTIDYESNWNEVYYPKMCALGYPKFKPGRWLF